MALYLVYFVPAAIWTAAETSIAVASACLPSLRPLFVRVVWGGASRPNRDGSFTSFDRLSLIWRGGSQTRDRNFSRIADRALGTSGSWTNNVAVYGGKAVRGTEEDTLELSGPREEDIETPINRIRAQTTVVLTVSERVDWRDDLF